MSAVERIDVEGYTVKISYDDSAENPFKEFAGEPTLVLHSKAERHFGWTTDEEWGSRLNAAVDELNERHPLPECLAIIDRWLRVCHGVLVVLPVGAVEHGGIAAYIGSGAAFGDPGGWDSGWVGWLFATPAQLAEWGGEWDAAKLEQDLRNSFKEFAAWVASEVYGYTITDSDGEDVNSCWGFYGDDWMLRQGYMWDQITDDIRSHREEKAEKQRVEQQERADDGQEIDELASAETGFPHREEQ